MIGQNENSGLIAEIQLLVLSTTRGEPPPSAGGGSRLCCRRGAGAAQKALAPDFQPA